MKELLSDVSGAGTNGDHSLTAQGSAAAANLTIGTFRTNGSRRKAGPNIERPCLHCGTTIKVFASRDADGKGQYCSKRCMWAYLATPVAQAKRFWLYVKKDEPDECWEWQGSLLKNGRGQFRVSRAEMEQAHRFAWRLVHGNIPDGMNICHHCDNGICVNERHLFLGTTQDNVDDKIRKGRQIRGEQIGVAKLTEPQVIKIRRLYAGGVMNTVELSKQFGVVTACIGAIIRRKTWRHLP